MRFSNTRDWTDIGSTSSEVDAASADMFATCDALFRTGNTVGTLVTQAKSSSASATVTIRAGSTITVQEVQELGTP